MDLGTVTAAWRGSTSQATSSTTQRPAGARAASESDTVTIQGGTASLEVTRIVVERVLVRVESEAGASGATAAGAAERWASQDQSPDAVSQRVVDGVTGAIFSAFVDSRPDMTSEDLANFKEQVFRGVQKGVEEAREVLSALSVLSDSIDDTIDETVSLIYEKLDRWFAELEGSHQAA